MSVLPTTTPTNTVLTFTEPQLTHLALYCARVDAAQATLDAERRALAEAFTLLLVGRGVDLARYEAALEQDDAGRPIAVLTAREAT